MHGKSQRIRAFTLIELLAVVMVILILAGIMFGVAGYVQKKMQTAVARTQLAAMSAALESYKADWGYYPVTCPCRVSASFFCESTNNWILLRALSGASGGRRYYKFPVSQLRPSSATASNLLMGGVTTTGGLTNFLDVWGTPYNYFNSPGTTRSNVNPCVNGVFNLGYVMGGQVNGGSYDLWSYGSDRFTFIPNGAFIISGACGGFNIYPWYNPAWVTPASALDDVTNFGR